MAERTATGRLRRLLALVPYVLQHQGAPLADVAERFGVSESELIDDLKLLWVCGLPGYSHLELIDVSYESGDVYIRNADVISAPMRLHRDEALSLLIGLQVIEQSADAETRSAIADLRAKLLAATAGDEGEASERVVVVNDEQSPVGPTVAEALGRQRRLLIDYHVPSRDEITRREIDPIAVTTIDGNTYLRAWCRSAEAIRHFRLDRIQVAKIVDRPAAPPVADAAFDRAFTPPVDATTARLRLQPSARWLVEFLGADVRSEDDRELIVEVTVGDPDRILALARQLGGSVEILEPGDWRERLRMSAREALALYS
jgi:proteasome accessory factor C